MRPCGWQLDSDSDLNSVPHTNATAVRRQIQEATTGWFVSDRQGELRSTGRAARHFAVNDIIWRALVKADVPSSKEPPGLIRNDGKRPDGATLVPWASVKYISWDTTTVHTCAASYIHLTSVVPGGAAEHAADRKRAKYCNLPATHDFVPVAIESLGPVNRTGRAFLTELGRGVTAMSCDPRETAHLFQRLSICSLRFNAIAFRGTFPQSAVAMDRWLCAPE